MTFHISCMKLNGFSLGLLQFFLLGQFSQELVLQYCIRSYGCSCIPCPCLICCEAYKFHNRVQLDSICFIELGISYPILFTISLSLVLPVTSTPLLHEIQMPFPKFLGGRTWLPDWSRKFWQTWEFATSNLMCYGYKCPHAHTFSWGCPILKTVES